MRPRSSFDPGADEIGFRSKQHPEDNGRRYDFVAGEDLEAGTRHTTHRWAGAGTRHPAAINKDALWWKPERLLSDKIFYVV